VIDGLPDVEPLRDRLGHETKQLQQSSAGLKRGGGYDWQPAVLDVAVEDILELLDQLDDAANKLGFSASATEKLPNDRASEDDLKALLETRGQSEAVDNLPSEQEADG